ncbi:MAG TPA: UbiD family decarboxylase [Chloroflexota bacterium]
MSIAPPVALRNPDLRSFLTDYELANPTQVWRIKEPIAQEYVTTAWVLELEKVGHAPLLIFENVTGSDMPVVVNIFGSRERIAHILGTTADGLIERWNKLTAAAVPPVIVDLGPCQERVLTGGDVDATKLPILRHFKGDAGCYVTSGMSISNDPDTGVRNLTYARMQRKGAHKFGVSFHSRGHHWDYLARYEKQGRNMPMAVAIGGHPAMLIGTATRGAIDLDEFDVVGGLMGQPVELVRGKTIDVCVPATAEIVLEGEVLCGVREPEGPFGEYTGYSSGRSTENVFIVSAITMRSSPIFLDVTPGFSSEHLLLARTQKEAMVLAKLREVYPAVKRLHYPKSGTQFHAYAAIEKSFEGQARQVGMLLLGLDQYVKNVVIVDTDVNVANDSEVLWAIATRTQATRDFSIIQQGLTNQLDPSSRGGMSDKVIIDATAPLDWDAVRTEIPAEVEATVRRSIEARLGR